MSSDFGAQGGGAQGGLTREQAIAKLKPPAICLLIVGALGLLFAVGGLLFTEAVIAWIEGLEGLPPEAMDGIEQAKADLHSPMRFATAALALAVDGFIIFAAVKMMRGSRGLGIAAAIVSMVNIMQCCCILGLPFGIWALVVLLNADVAKALAADARPAF